MTLRWPWLATWPCTHRVENGDNAIYRSKLAEWPCADQVDNATWPHLDQGLRCNTDLAENATWPYTDNCWRLSLRKLRSFHITLWTQSLVITFPKKGNPQQCQNYRTISLISHSSKVMLKIILNRLKPQAEKIIAEEQAGFRAGRSTTEQIFNLRILCEKYL